jgi:hypothetical protein
VFRDIKKIKIKRKRLVESKTIPSSEFVLFFHTLLILMTVTCLTIDIGVPV